MNGVFERGCEVKGREEEEVSKSAPGVKLTLHNYNYRTGPARSWVRNREQGRSGCKKEPKGNKGKKGKDRTTLGERSGGDPRKGTEEDLKLSTIHGK